VEGNYLLMEEGEWTGLGNLFDERWYGPKLDIHQPTWDVEATLMLIVLS